MPRAKPLPEQQQGTIVCGTDFSIHAMEAANAAAALAGKTGDELLLVHVVPKSGLGELTAVAETSRETGRKQLQKEANRIRKLGITVHEEVLIGPAYEMLAQAASRTGVRLVVVASIGWVSPAQWFVGSVAERTVETSPVPVLVVRESTPIEDWARGKQALRMVVGADFSRTSDAALEWAGALSRFGACEIVVTHVNWPPSDWRRLGYSGPGRLVGNPAEIEEVLLRDLKRKTKQALGDHAARIVVEPSWGRIDFEIIAIAAREKADVIVVGTHQRQGVSRFWLGSTSRGLLHHAPMNIVIIPQPQARAGGASIPQVRRVLVPTDFSELGNHAIAHAYSILPQGGVVRMVHVLAPHRGPRTGFQKKPFTSTSQTKALKSAEDQLRQFVPVDALQRNIETETEAIEHENPAEAICQASERFGADVICIGSHGRSRVTTSLLGSVAQAIIACSQRPVLVIRQPKA